MAEYEEEYLPGGGIKIPDKLKERMDRGRERMRDDAPTRNECWSFFRNEQYVYRSPKNNLLVSQSTITEPDGSGKPRHRVRTTRNMITDIVMHEVAAATQRIPAYEVNPSTSDPKDISAARLGAKVLRYGYDKWMIRKVVEQVITSAVVADEGFAWPYWDSTIGPFLVAPGESENEAAVIGEGELRIATFSGNEVYWEPGLRFDESPWHVVEQARTLESVTDSEGYVGGELRADAQADDMPAPKKYESAQAKLVLVSEYLERPCPKYPQGRWLTIANGKQIMEERPYPCTDASGRPTNDPVLHKLSYVTDPDSDRDLGLVRFLLDAQRTINDCTNKMLEWKNLALNPQVVIQNGEFKQRLTDEPGAVYHAVGTGEITWREVPNIPSELMALKEEAKEDMARIAAQNDIPSQVESGKGIIALQEKDQSRRAAFLNNLAEFYSRLGRHCLYLVQKHYTEPRLLSIRSPEDTELIHDFMGADLRGQADVTVWPGSLEPRSKASLKEEAMIFAQNGWISPEQAMQSILDGTTEGLLKGVEQDKARAREVIQKIKDGPEFLFMAEPRLALPDEQIDPLTGMPRIDPETGMPITTVPSWMPRPFDNIGVHKAVFETWMKTSDYDMLEPPQQEAANTYYAALLNLERQQAMAAAQMQTQMAEGLGMANAAKPQGPTEMPDQQSLDADTASYSE